MAEVTNYIDRLVAELCPDGVDFYTIEELITLDFGTRITKSEDAGTIYPVYGGGGASFRTDNYNREDKYVVSRFAMSEKCVRYVSGKFWMLDSGFTYSVKDESLLSYKYISYWLLNAQQEIYACSSQSAQRNLKTADFKRFEVPVPPLEIQEAIVEILDKFTNLEAELEAELEARTLQNGYYRDSLFEALDCPSVPLNDLLDYEQPTKYLVSSKDYDDSYPTPVLTAGKTFILGYTNETEGIYPASEEEPVIIFDDFTTAFKWVEFPFKAKSSAMKMLTLKSGTNSLFKYVYYAMQCIVYNSSDHARQWISKYSNIEIPIPSLEEQQRIVDILDRFDALTTSLSEGLPAELAARRSQYEYYRDQLLTFPRKGENQ